MTDIDLGKLIVARTAQGVFVAIGKMIGYCDAPTAVIKTPGGQKIHWRADMCSVLASEEALVDAVCSPQAATHPFSLSCSPDVCGICGLSFASHKETK